MAALDEIMHLDAEAFFAYVKSLEYGYQDKSGEIHAASEEDFSIKDYSS